MLKIVPGGFRLNGQHTPKLIGRTAFKLSNALTYKFRGWSKYGDSYVNRYIEQQQKLFGPHVVLRVLLETAGWNPTDNGMFGSEPRDQGFWNVEALKDGHREKDVHPIGKRVLEWFFKVSQETGVAFELVIDATLKHTDGVKAGEVDHVIRQVGIEMGELHLKYPRSLIIPNVRNEWNAHNKTRHTLAAVNMWAHRWERDQYWPGSQPIVCPGGGDMYTYAVGRPGSGKFAMGLIHPDRQPDNRHWTQMPNIHALRAKASGMPVGFNESMYYVERRGNIAQAEAWYRNRRGWTDDWNSYKTFAERAINAVDYFIFHDEKGLQCDLNWPFPDLTKLEHHFRVDIGVEPPPVIPDVPDPDVPDPEPEPDEDSWLEDLLSKIDGDSIAALLPLLLPLLSGKGIEIGDIEELLQARIDAAVGPVLEQLNRIEQNTDLILNAIDELDTVVVVEEDDDPDEPDIPEPPPVKRPTDYIPWDDREEWAARVDLAYTPWRGHRDLQYLHDHYTDDDEQELGISRDQLKAIIVTMSEAHVEGGKLAHRINTEKHREFADRSQVRKVIANDAIKELKQLTAVYSDIASRFPDVPGCDSIRCKLKKMRS
jgi:hypothetical protein